MTTKKWLNIIVDGNSALSPYWPKIVSEYLDKIVRSFFGNSTEQEANCELGFVMYNNANYTAGLDVQYIDWTTDVDYFLGTLSLLTFKGDNLNQYNIVEGLEKALLMFPRPSDKMTIQEYYEGERHCILATASDPIARRMLVTVPITEERQLFQLKSLNADCLEMAQMFAQLAVSLSIITPKQHPIFASIFNLGNNYPPMVNTLISNHRINQLTILLSRNFKEAHDALREKRRMDSPSKQSVESMKTTNDIILPIDFASSSCQEDLFSASNKTIREKTIEVAQEVRLESTSPFSPATLNATTNQAHVPLVSCSQSLDAYDDIIAELSNDEDIFPPDVLGEMEAELRQVLEDTTQNVSNNFGLVHEGRNIQSYSSSSFQPMHNNGSTSDQHFPNHEQYHTNGFSPLGTLASPVSTMPRINQGHFWLSPPSLADFKDYMLAWEGSLVGRINGKRKSVHSAEALRRPTSPLTLTNEWPIRLEIALFVPKKAVNHTMRIHPGPIDYVFIHIIQFSSLDLYNHLTTKNMCAKIILPSQTLVLSTTESKHHYIGTVFPGDTIFIEPHEECN